jgi:hypothetical protein
MSDTKNIRILYLADAFLSKYFDQEYHNGRLNRGSVRTFVGNTSVDKTFFDTMNTDQSLNARDYETFKTIIYGHGKNCFRFNDKKYNKFDHSSIITVADVFNVFKDPDISLSFFVHNKHKTIHLSTLHNFIYFHIATIVNTHKNKIISSFEDLGNDASVRSQLKDYFSNIIFYSQSNFEAVWLNLIENITNKFIKHFEGQDIVFVEHGVCSSTYVFSNSNVKKNVLIDNFIDNAVFFDKNDVSSIIDIINKNKDKIEKSVEDEFYNTLQTEKKAIDLELEHKRLKGHIDYEQKAKNDTK